MARGVRLSGASLAWVLGALGLAAGAWLVRGLPPNTIDWQPRLVFTEPWRAWSAALLHYSHLHLAANTLGAALIAWLGAAARVDARSVWAWAAAWPLTHWGLLLRPDLAHYGGLSGVLHAGVVVAAVFLWRAGRRRQRLVGIALLAGVALKIASEAPWGPALQQVAGWDMPIAPAAHASGAAAGLLCALLAAAWPGRAATMPHDA